MPPSLSVVVPVFNPDPGVLRSLVERLRRVAGGLAAPHEVILVDDGGGAAGWEAALALARDFPEVSGLRLARNFGQHNALLCGVRAARHEVVVTMDDDLQHFPEQIPALLEKLGEADVVYGAPVAEQHGLLRNLASVLVKRLLKHVMATPEALHVSAFRAFRRDLRESFAPFRSPAVCLDVLLSWGTSRFAHVKVPHGPRRAGKSQYTAGKLLRHAANIVTGFSAAPLQLASWLGMGFALFGMGIFLYVVGRYLRHGSPVPGFPFLASIIALFSGAQLFALGVMGEYMARTHFRVMERPVYVVRERTRPAEPR